MDLQESVGRRTNEFMPKKNKQQPSSILQTMLILAVFAALAIAAYTAYRFVRNAYAHEQKLIAQEISEIKIFSDEEIFLEAAKSANLELPVNKPLKTPGQIAKEAEVSARKMTDEKFNQKVIAPQISTIINSYKEATPGQKIEFISKNAKDTVRGTYKGREGIFVLVDTQKYSMRDIQDEYKYLFDSDLATAKAQEMLNELKTSFKEEGVRYFEENRKRIEEELRASSGYMKLEAGNWRAKSDVLKEAFDKLKLQKENAIKTETKKIIRKHKLFGVFTVSPSNSQ